jgi:hypothetical protein
MSVSLIGNSLLFDFSTILPPPTPNPNGKTVLVPVLPVKPVLLLSLLSYPLGPPLTILLY